MVKTAVIYPSSCENSVVQTVKNHTENGKFCPKCPILTFDPPYAVQKLF